MILLDHLPILDTTGHETARVLLRRMYQQHFGKEMPEIVCEERGKPRFADGSIHFSITHTPHHAFCVLSDIPVGIDAEEVQRVINPRLAEKILSPAEKIRYAASDHPSEALLRLWVLKEAQVKCTGEGLRGYPNHTDFSPEDPRIQILEGCFVAIIQKEEPYAI